MFYSALNKFLLWIEGPFLTFLKNNWKAILIVAGIVYLILSIRAFSEKNKLIADLQAAGKYSDSIANSKISYWTDKYGAEHAIVENITVEKAALAEVLDSTAKLLDIKASQITAISSSGMKIEVHEKLRVDTFTTKVPCNGNDSISVVNKYDFHYKDPWLTVDGTVGNHEDTINAIGYDTLKRTDYTKKSWLFGATHSYSDFTNTNPHVKLVGYKGVEFNSTVKHWSIGPDLQVGYPLGGPFNISKPQLFIGVSIQYSILRL